MAHSGKTFYRAARLLPPAVREDIVALYAFCRRVDDLADEPEGPAAQNFYQLQAVAQELRHGGGERSLALGWSFAGDARRALLARAAAALVGAAAADVAQQQPACLDALLRYTFGVAGTVGLMLAELLGADSVARAAAIALGMAMQLSNIARDVAEDWRNGRIYLPADWIGQDAVFAALTTQEPSAAQQLVDATERVVALADQLYEQSFDGIAFLPWRVRWGILAAALCYREIGIKTSRDVARSWQQRTVVSTARKLVLIGLAALRLLLPRYWRKARPKRPAWLGLLAPQLAEAGVSL